MLSLVVELKGQQLCPGRQRGKESPFRTLNKLADDFLSLLFYLFLLPDLSFFADQKFGLLIGEVKGRLPLSFDEPSLLYPGADETGYLLMEEGEQGNAYSNDDQCDKDSFYP